MKILFVVPGPIQWATSRFRAYWIQPLIPDSEIVLYPELAQLSPDKMIEALEPYDCVIWLKQCPVHVLKDKVRKGQKHFWDVTDPMWWFGPEWAREVATFVDGTIVSSPGLMENFNMWKPSKAKKAVCIDDHMNLDHYNVVREHASNDDAPVKLIWFGLALNRFTLLGALPYLSRAHTNGRNITLTIFDDQPTNHWEAIADFTTMHVDFDPETEAEVLASHDIAILPKYPGPWGKCKSINKDLTAYAAGLPVLRGNNYLRLLRLIDDPSARQVLADGNRAMVEDRYQSKYHAEKLMNLLGEE